MWFDRDSEAAQSWLQGARPILGAKQAFLEVTVEGVDAGESE